MDGFWWLLSTAAVLVLGMVALTVMDVVGVW